MKRKTFWGVTLAAAIPLFLTSCKKEKDIPQIQIQSVAVRTARLTPMEFQKRIRVQGNVQAIDRVTLSAKVSGTIDTLKAREGYHVKKGDVLFQTDRKNLENQVLLAEENLKVAEETYKTTQEDAIIARTTLNKAQLDFNRQKQLMDQQAVSRTSYEAATADYERASAAARKQEAVLNYTKIKISQARTNLEIAQKNLRDSVIHAPYDGVITARYHEEGEFAAAGGKILDLEDQTRLEVTARISAVYYEMVSRNTEVILHFNGREICRAVITYISPDIDPLSRTFEIRAAIPGVKNAVSGSLYDVDILLQKRNGLGIPTDSVIARARGEYALFAVKDGKTAEEISVVPGFSMNGFTEILNAESLKNRDIVTVGQYFLNDNSPVQVISGEKGRTEAGR